MWKGKYIIKEHETGITVFHNTNKATMGQFFSISIYGTEADWNELMQTEEDGWPFKKLGIKDGMILVKTGPSDEQYDASTVEGKELSEEYFKLAEQIDTILSSFKII
ncbi:hypothetical protein EHS13_30050 [Paenibacillus psychroresistens]|uniref:Uncharacterized protein n=1 Tax=Paenibacillus psychroresistens TaxID=1778678 RepID=A0A6B8RR07_9BACL|nr:hypothetical protein [Paenibacillus psychroresistens]QGQ98820.1 hypothetical protein EHS13_30050 [Paenibacillus psychroresistens]